MRNTSAWRTSLIRRLRDQWPATATRIGPAALCDVELGLALLEALLPGAPARALWVILAGYPFPLPEAETWSDAQHRMLSNARHLLTAFKSPYPWQRTLEHYRQVEERLRGYTIQHPDQPPIRRAVSVCANRWDVYTQALGHAPNYARTEIHWASNGTYGFIERRRLISIRIPADLSLPPLPTGHALAGQSSRAPLTVPWNELLDTARWMDDQLWTTRTDGGQTESASRRSTWEQRLGRVQLEVFNQERTVLTQATSLRLEGLIHLIGMVSSGKSTLYGCTRRLGGAQTQAHHVGCRRCYLGLGSRGSLSATRPARRAYFGRLQS